ncbi:NAC domain-containing protein 7 [Morella rubra]|uniref:NAC domain-containing protein 7 n=1 Tax=Morella rubra TaxID=262757 RepID=A0A6A1WSE9_9ROSI|nr:NAC domain-containing protein 7 [Morella rubra]
MDPQWFFFSLPEMKYRRGNQSKRSTKAGFWKPTGNDRKIMSESSIIGMKKTLVFYEGRAPACKKTSWVTHEYRTNPYQHNSFLLGLLFDKREGPNGAEPSVQSPTTSKPHLDETNSEIALGSVSASSEVHVADFGTRTINEEGKASEELVVGGISRGLSGPKGIHLKAGRVLVCGPGGAVASRALSEPQTIHLKAGRVRHQIWSIAFKVAGVVVLFIVSISILGGLKFS